MKEIKKKIHRNIDEYFDNVSMIDLKPNSWKVPIGGGFYGADEVKAVIDCYLTGALSIQKPVREFENEFSKYIGVKNGIATNSGTSANILALNALLDAGLLNKGDEVALPATTFITVATPIIQLGLIPVYIDIDKNTLNINPRKLEKSIKDPKRNIKCTMIVHTLGNDNDVHIIEDCCEAHGAKWNNQKVGSFGIMSTWSFYVAHHMTTAEGGMVTTNSDDLDIILRELREFGRDKGYKGERYGISTGNLKDFDERYTFHRVGWNFRMADAPASFGLQQLKKLDIMNKKRLVNASHLTNALEAYKDLIYVLPKNNTIDGNLNTFYSFPIVIKDDRINRKEFACFLEDNSIETRAIMCGTLPDQPSLLNQVGVSYGQLSNSRFVSNNGFFVGCHPCLEIKDLDYVVDTIKKYFSLKELI